MNPKRKDALNKLIKTEIMVRKVKKKSENFVKNKRLLDDLDKITNNFDDAFMVSKSGQKNFDKIDKFNKNFKPENQSSMLDIGFNSPRLDLARNIDLYDDRQYFPKNYKQDTRELTFNLFPNFGEVVDNIKRYCYYITILICVIAVGFCGFKLYYFLKNKKLLFFAEKK